MSARGTVKWRHIVELAKKHGVEVLMGKGGERKLKGRGADGKFTQVRIGHRCCNHAGSEVWAPYLKTIQRHFGWTDEELYK